MSTIFNPPFRSSNVKFKPIERLKQDVDLEFRLNQIRNLNIETNILKEQENPITRDEYLIASQEQGVKIVDTSKLLTSDSIQARKKILKEFNWDSDIQDIEKGKGENIEREIEEKNYNKTPVYFLEEIEKIADDFGLKFKKANKLLWSETDFKYDLVGEIESFCSKLKNSNGFDWESNNFYALAIPEDFANSGREKPKSRTPRIVLFYKTDPKKDTYIIVKTWGETTYPLLQVANAWTKQNDSRKFLVSSLSSFAVLFPFFSYVLSSSLVGGFFVSFVASALLGISLIKFKIS